MRLLLVEDSRRLTELIVESVHGAGWRIDGVGTLAEAFVTLQCEEHDLLVLDLGLPDGNGVDLMRKLSSKQPLFGIALTGFGMEADIRRSREVGFQHHLVKPIDLNKLDALIQESAAAAPTVPNSLAGLV